MDDMHHNLVCAFEDLMDTKISQVALNRIVLKVAVPTVHLEAIIDDVEALVRRKLLSHRTVHRVVGVTSIDEIGSMSYHQSGSLQVSGHFRKLELQVLVGSDWLSELLTSLNIVSRRLYASSGTSERATGDVKSTAVEA